MTLSGSLQEGMGGYWSMELDTSESNIQYLYNYGLIAPKFEFPDLDKGLVTNLNSADED